MGLTLFLTEVSSMTPCQFNNLSSLCTAIFSECRGRLYTRYNLSTSLKNGDCTHAMISVIVKKIHINPMSIDQNQGIEAKYFMTLC